jgi:hypothetical protein
MTRMPTAAGLGLALLLGTAGVATAQDDCATSKRLSYTTGYRGYDSQPASTIGGIFNVMAPTTPISAYD